MNNFLLLLKNINSYGFLSFAKIVLYEAYNSLKFRELKSLTYEQKNTDDYRTTKINNFYNTPYIPTPYYFLSIISKYLKNNKIDDFLLLDLGCGYARIQNYFSKNFKSLFLGFDYNSKIINYLNKKKIKRSFFFKIDLREKKSLKLVSSIIKKYKGNKKLVIFFSDSFDVYLLNKILKNLSKKYRFYCILINIDKEKILSMKYSKLFSFKFKSKSRNIKILRIDVSK